ncbi:ATP-dependent DNA helicase [Thalassospira sp.]|uniref:ATP-dependent DNA helicase n=1 Tax=Thalassospira sp. TaxID=1912094 RepID=UPI002736ABDD|nr:ATP-dependent DNA helicase [Thalassospira sp.]MDP2697622.1 ATP-dependent DNA helicase [Thalassospira sp.]
MFDDRSDPVPRFLPPDAPVMVAGLRHAVFLTPDGEIDEMPLATAAKRARKQRPIVVHLPATARRLKIEGFGGYDLLELFAFVRPAQFCVPTPRGIALATGQKPSDDLTGQAEAMAEAMKRLLQELAILDRDKRARALALAWPMARGTWAWGMPVLAALGADGDGPHKFAVYEGLKIWKKIGEWSEHAPPPTPGHIGVEPVEARERLRSLLGDGAEERPQQADYASAVCSAFAPRTAEGAPNIVLAEAGTGTGKTLGYVAPASLWAQKNEGAVWISTYTRNLQRQIDSELDRLYDDPVKKRLKAVVRKGRENYLCLLNFEEAQRPLAQQPHQAVPLGLMARWALATRDGDMVGGDFPAWLTELIGTRFTSALADQRGECIYAACPHYTRCFVEKTVRRARSAEIVVANHALVMVQAALGGLDDAAMPTRYVFDEGHHLFDAADKAFSAHLTGQEGAELRRWLLGAENRGGSRARGLKQRLESLIAERSELRDAVHAVIHAAGCLPEQGWLMRIQDGAEHAKGPAEIFLAHIRAQVTARATESDRGYSIETDCKPAIEAVLKSAADLDRALAALEKPAKALIKIITHMLDEKADELESGERQRLDAAIRSLERRAIMQVAAWRGMLASLVENTPAQFVDWFAIERQFGRDFDIGMHRHYLDPTLPLTAALAPTAHGMVITSATLRDGTGDEMFDWAVAEDRTGASHMPLPAVRAALKSPYDYARQTRVFIVNDLGRDNADHVAAAYRELFLASKGGALGLFTAISRLRAVYDRLTGPLDEAGLQLLAQHIDGMDVSTLIDIFRVERDACLLGTDAVRDGVDVPGDSLRLIVFDRVPWPRPDILHRARKAAFHGARYDDMLTRLRMKQAFGRLVRRAEDRGVFVLLDNRMPTRLLGAFPEDVAVQRVGLKEAIEQTRLFLQSQ